MADAAAGRAAVPLKPLRTPPLKEQVVHELIRLIDADALQPGDRIPTERELSEQLAVSRSTVREAVQLLQALGTLEIRHGSGTYVAASAERAQELRQEWRRWTQRHAGRVHELLEVRRGIESFAAELGAQRIAFASTPSPGLAAMDDALVAMQEARDASDVPALVRADMLFHRALCETTGNLALVELTELISRELVRERAASWDLDGRPDRSLVEHREIYRAVCAGDGDGARAAVLSHLRSVELDIRSSVLAGESAEPREKGERP
jgi:GntR family transcriptional repressor for pyruvate dehydrogenase complex